MEFCPKCGNVLVAKKEDNKVILQCRRCGYSVVKEAKKYKSVEIEEKIEENPRGDVVLVKEKIDTLPKANVTCPKCGHNEAVWWLQQTRSADEPPTTFYRCTKCGHSWREY